MKLWVCVVLGISMAIVYKIYQNYKNRKLAEKLQEQIKKENEINNK